LLKETQHPKYIVIVVGATNNIRQLRDNLIAQGKNLALRIRNSELSSNLSQSPLEIDRRAVLQGPTAANPPQRLKFEPVQSVGLLDLEKVALLLHLILLRWLLWGLGDAKELLTGQLLDLGQRWPPALLVGDATLDVVLRALNEIHRQKIELPIVSIRDLYIGDREALTNHLEVASDNSFDGVHTAFPSQVYPTSGSGRHEGDGT